MSTDDDWERYPIPPIGLAIERYVPWPAALAELTSGANFYQRIPDTEGLVFLRYGAQETPETYLNSLVDAVRMYEIVDDRTVEFLGDRARRLTITQHRSEMGVYRSEQSGDPPTHTTLPRMTTLIEITAFTAHGLPVLVGFRIDVDRMPEHRSVIDRIVASVSLLA